MNCSWKEQLYYHININKRILNKKLILYGNIVEINLFSTEKEDIFYWEETFDMTELVNVVTTLTATQEHKATKVRRLTIEEMERILKEATVFWGNNKKFTCNDWGKQRKTLYAQLLPGKRTGKGKVQCTLAQAMRLCRERTAHRRSRGIALFFLDHSIGRGWGIRATPLTFFTPGKDPAPIVQEAGWAPGPVCTGAENLAPHRDSIPGPSNP